MLGGGTSGYLINHSETCVIPFRYLLLLLSALAVCPCLDHCVTFEVGFRGQGVYHCGDVRAH